MLSTPRPVSTPRPSQCRPSISATLGEPCRTGCSRLQRTASPGGASLDSLDVVTPRRRAGASVPAASRPPLRPAPAVRHSRDPRPIGDKQYTQQCARNVADLLLSRGFGKVSYEKLLRDPSTRDFFEIFRFLITQLDPHHEMEGKLEDEVPAIMRKLRYPVEVNRSKLQAICGPNTWPQLLAVLDWLVNVIRVDDDFIEPIAACELGLGESDSHDMADHEMLRSLHENYVHFLGNSDDHGSEEHFRQIYEERLAAIQNEVERLQRQHLEMEQRLQEFRMEHERLLELQQEPAGLELEAEKLRSGIQAAEAKVTQLEEEIAQVEAKEKVQQAELASLKELLPRLEEQVKSQAYSKKDIERLKCERGQLRQKQANGKAELERLDEEVWELGMKESNWLEAIGRLARSANEGVEALAKEDSALEAGLKLKLEEAPELSPQAFEQLGKQLHSFAAKKGEALAAEEAAKAAVLEEQKAVQRQLEEKERDKRRLKTRLEQLQRMQQEYRAWSSEQLDDAQRTAEASEDAVHAVAIGTAAPSLRDAAEVDRLRMELNEEKLRSAAEKAQLQEALRRDEERMEAHLRRVAAELESFAKSTAELLEKAELMLEGEVPARPSLGGC